MLGLFTGRQQTVGWPPVKSFARNQNPVIPSPPPASPASPVTVPAQGKASSSAPPPNSLYVKIYMDGVPIGRKVDLKTNNSYDKLYWVIEEMFQQFVNGMPSSLSVYFILFYTLFYVS